MLSASPASSHSDFWNKYELRFRDDSHFLVIQGFADAAALIKAATKETNITGFIVDKIKDFLRATDDDRFDDYAVKENDPQPGEGRIGSRRRQVDILFERTKRPRAEYTFEAKRLERKDHRIGTYTGLTAWQKKPREIDGMLRFIEGETYAAGCSEAAFIAYIQSDTIEYWHNQLHQSLQDEVVLQRLQGLKVVTSHLHPHTWSSEHNRKDGTQITLYHLFFDCHS